MSVRSLLRMTARLLCIHKSVVILVLLLSMALFSAGSIAAQEPDVAGRQAPVEPADVTGISDNWAPSGVHTPHALGVDTSLHRIFVTSQSNNYVVALNGAGQFLSAMWSGDGPHALTVNQATHKVYSASVVYGTIYVHDGQTFAELAPINLNFGRQITFLDSKGSWVFAVSNFDNKFFVINANTDQVTHDIALPGAGAWGLVAHPTLNRAYVSLSGTGTVVTLDGLFGWQPVPATEIRPCGTAPGDAPYQLGFDASRQQLVVACAHGARVTEVVGYQVDTWGWGLQYQWRYPVGDGGGVGGSIAANPATGNIFVTNPNAGTVTVIDPECGPIATVPVGMGPEGVTIDTVSGRALVANRFSSTISVLSDTYRPTLCHPNNVAVDPLTKRVYVTSRDNDALLMLDGNTSTLNLLARADTGHLPWGVALDPTPGSKRVYVANFGSNTVQVFDGDTLALLKTFNTGIEPTMVAVNRVTRYAYTVSHGATSRLWAINGANLAGPSSIPLDGNGAWGVAVDEQDNLICVSIRNGGWLACYDGVRWGYKIPDVPSLPCGGRDIYSIAMNPNNEKLYAACAGADGSVSRMAIVQYTGGHWTPVGLVPVGNGGDNGGGGIAINTATNHVYFTNSVGRTVTIYNGAEQLLGTLPAGYDPFGATADPTTNRIYIVLRGENRVKVLNDIWYRVWLPRIVR